MKKQIITLAALLFAVCAWAETETEKVNSTTPLETKNAEMIESPAVNGAYYKCTGNNVWMRTGPGKQYAPVNTDSGQVQLMKGDWVQALGGVKNGYRYVSAGLEGYGDVYGWVSTKYLRPIR